MAKKTPLYDTHVRENGKIVEFGGWLLPVQYSGILAEHQAVRERAGLFDVSHMGEFIVQGEAATEFINFLVTNDVSKLAKQQIQYSPMCYEDGGTVDDLLIYKFSDQKYLLVVNAANIEKDWEWAEKSSQDFAVKLENRSEQIAQLALQGPLAPAILAKLTDAPIDAIPYYWFQDDVTVAGKKTLVSRTGYTGEDGYEIYCQAADAAELWQSLRKAGEAEGLLPAGLGCRDTLRFEACFPLYGHELSQEISPLEAGIGRFVKLDKADFCGKAALVKQKAAKLTRKVVGLAMEGRGIARAGYPVVVDGQTIGRVTTGSVAPTVNQNLGLALLDAKYAVVGQKIAVEIRGKAVAARVIAKPFYQREEQKK